MTTTGSLMRGCTNGMSEHLKTEGANFPTIYWVRENPDTVLTSNAGSDLALNPIDGSYYMSTTAGGSTWYNLGSMT